MGLRVTAWSVSASIQFREVVKEQWFTTVQVLRGPLTDKKCWTCAHQGEGLGFVKTDNANDRLMLQANRLRNRHMLITTRCLFFSSRLQNKSNVIRSDLNVFTWKRVTDPQLYNLCYSG